MNTLSTAFIGGVEDTWLLERYAIIDLTSNIIRGVCTVERWRLLLETPCICKIALNKEQKYNNMDSVTIFFFFYSFAPVLFYA